MYHLVQCHLWIRFTFLTRTSASGGDGKESVFSLSPFLSPSEVFILKFKTELKWKWFYLQFFIQFDSDTQIWTSQQSICPVDWSVSSVSNEWFWNSLFTVCVWNDEYFMLHHSLYQMWNCNRVGVEGSKAKYGDEKQRTPEKCKAKSEIYIQFEHLWKKFTLDSTNTKSKIV